ncbi:MAG TPA: aminotransferase class V-fold PLP-dependent enzyme, partial [Dongiaceae bacterium]|nr:aminotransferase class V-fold PLP-dependent enzyme [Dongiaceae bacterium]
GSAGVIELQPSRFLLRELSAITPADPLPRPRLRVAADAVAAFVGARGADFAFVENVTAGCNAVLRSLDLRAGDEILVTDLGYGAVTHAARYAARTRDAAVRVVEVPFPGVTPASVRDTVLAAIGPRTRLVVVDHVTSSTALILPIAEIAAGAHARGAAVLVDGAHAPGAIPLDVPAAGADWYSANLHKWAWSPRSAGFLWTDPRHQTTTHPLTISWGLDQGYTAEFDWVGTRDPSGYLAAPAALDFMRSLGVEAVMGYDHALAWEAARWLTSRWAEALPCPESMVGTMAAVPLPASFGGGDETAKRLRLDLLVQDRIEAQIHSIHDRLWVRISAQIYNEMSDIERLAHAIEARR